MIYENIKTYFNKKIIFLFFILSFAFLLTAGCFQSNNQNTQQSTQQTQIPTNNAQKIEEKKETNVNGTNNELSDSELIEIENITEKEKEESLIDILNNQNLIENVSESVVDDSLIISNAPYEDALNSHVEDLNIFLE